MTETDRTVDFYLRRSTPARLEAVSIMLQRLAGEIRSGGWSDSEIAQALEVPEALLSIMREDAARPYRPARVANG